MADPQDRGAAAGEHYFTSTPSSRSRPGAVRVPVPGADLVLTTDRGTFSPGRLDPGTAFLLERAPAPPAAGRFVDVGCGYGPIALHLAARCPDAEVVAVDVNDRALTLTRENAAAAGLGNIVVSRPDEAMGTFDLLWSNPPIRIGKDALHDLLDHWLGRLSPGGVAVLVVNRHLGADSLQRWLDGRGFPTERLASKKGYRLLRATAR